MLNYTTTTIVNTGANVSGFTKTDSNNNVLDKIFRVKYGPEIHNDGVIRKACLVGYEAYRAASLATVKVSNVAGTYNTTNAVYRLCIYVRQRNNNSPIFSNTWVFKGKPIYVEFNAGTTAAELKSLIEKYMLFIYGTEVFTMTTSGTSNRDLNITAKDQWTIFMDQEGNETVKVEVFNTTTNEWEISGSALVPNNGHEAFGDFDHIMKDLRLPSRENTSWFGTTVGAGENDDVPSVTGHYHQYTIQLTSERGVLQQSAVGGVGVSRTVHVFYVENSAKSNFETALTTAGIIVAADSTANPPVAGTVADMTIDHTSSPATVLHAMAEDSTIADDPSVVATATV